MHFSKLIKSSTNSNLKQRRRALDYFQQKHVDITSNRISRAFPIQSLYSKQPITRSEIRKFASVIHQEIPIRIARCVTQFRKLPFVVGCHEPIQEIHEIYMRDLRRLQEIRTHVGTTDNYDDVDDLIKMCREIMDDNTEVLPLF